MTPTSPMQKVKITLPSDREVVVERTFAASRVAVFSALTQPELLRRWMFAPGRTLTVCHVDLRPGGSYHFIFAGAGRRSVGVRGTYREVAGPGYLVNTERWDDWDAGETLVTNSLVERFGRTTLTVASRFPSKEVRDSVLAAGLSENAELVYSALADFLTEKARGVGAFA